MLENDVLIICPNEEKNFLLEQMDKEKRLMNIKFMDINEFISNYFYSYDYKTISYIINNYQVGIDISKTYLEAMYAISLDKIYKNQSLIFLQKLKKELISNSLLTFNNNFKNYLKYKKIKVVNYPKLEKYIDIELKKLNAEVINKNYSLKELKVLECDDIFDEIVNVCNKIVSLINNNVSLNNIYIVNCNDDYSYTINRVFKMFNILIDISNKDSIISTLFIKKYLKSRELEELNDKNKDLLKLLIDAINKLVYVEDDKNYDIFLNDLLNNTYLPAKKHLNSVKIGDLFNRSYSSDDHVFLIGFNEGVFPLMYKDEDYITDKMKDEIDFYKTKDKNEREKKIALNYLTNIPNLYLSYKLNSFKDKYYPSSMINDNNMEVSKYINDNYNNSSLYNKRMLAIYLDNFYKYREESIYLKPLLKTYSSTNLYNSYSNIFTGIDKNEFINYIKKIGLSYTSMNTYNLCGFKYYINYILKLDPYEETFSTFIGNIFHHILELFLLDGFCFEEEWNKYISNKNLSIKELFFLEKLKKNLLTELDLIKEQRMYTDFKSNYYEKSISVNLNHREVDAYFSGKIDKIMYCQNGCDTYFSIVDYKTGYFDSNLNNMKYGIGMQLATYLYLIEKSNIFSKPIFAGMYFQKVLMGNVSYDGRKSFLDKMRDSLKLVGYSTSDESVLSNFDHLYTDSKVIKSMKFTQNGFSRFSKLLNREEEFNIFKYTEKIIYDTLEKIVNTSFFINPKKIGGTDVSCIYCKYRDLCYKKEDDYVNLEKCDNLDFLGDDVDG